jgi:hypothetical protein
MRCARSFLFSFFLILRCLFVFGSMDGSIQFNAIQFNGSGSIPRYIADEPRPPWPKSGCEACDERARQAMTFSLPRVFFPLLPSPPDGARAPAINKNNPSKHKHGGREIVSPSSSCQQHNCHRTYPAPARLATRKFLLVSSRCARARARARAVFRIGPPIFTSEIRGGR